MSGLLLDENFDGPRLNPALRWHCPPTRWGIDPARACLWLEPEAGTDFWQKTHYGFEVDNGHFLFRETSGDFILTTRAVFHPAHQYDQAGLMVRLSAACWLKTSVEHEPDGPNRLGAVVTNSGHSDWSTRALAPEVKEVWLRIRLEGNGALVSASLDGASWEQIRMAPLLERGPGSTVACGVYACSPKGSGYRAEFAFLRLETP